MNSSECVNYKFGLLVKGWSLCEGRGAHHLLLHKTAFQPPGRSVLQGPKKISQIS